MFLKDIGKSIYKNGFYNRLAKNIFYSNYIKNILFSFSSTIDLTEVKHQHGDIADQTIKIDWSQLNNAHSIIQIIKENKIPSKVKLAQFYKIQMQLYITIMKLEEQKIQNNLFLILSQLHNSSLENLSKLKAVSLHQHDSLFNSFCIALFKGQMLIKSRNSTIIFKIQNDLTFIKSLLGENKSISSFEDEIIPNLSLDELKECCNVVCKANLIDQLLKIISTPEPYLSKENRDQLINHFFFQIPPRYLQSLHYLQELYQFHSDIVKNQNESKYNFNQIKKSKYLCSEIIEQYFKNIASSKNLNPQLPQIKKFFEIIKKSGFIVKKDQIMLFDQVIKNTSDLVGQQLDAYSELITLLKKLPFQSSEASEIQNYISNKENFNTKNVTSKRQTKISDISQDQIKDISSKLTRIDQPQEILKNKQFILLENIIKEQQDVSQIVKILWVLHKYNRKAAELLAVEERQSLINENITHFNFQTFSQLLDLDFQGIIKTHFDKIIQYMNKSIEVFPSALLVQSFSKIIRSEKNKVDLQQLKDKLIVLIQKKQSEFTIKQINYLTASLQFIKNETDQLIIQNIIEDQAKTYMAEDSRYLNAFLHIVQHKILKQGVQSQFTINQIDLLEKLIIANKVDLQQIDLFNYALFIIGINKFAQSNTIFKNFFELLNQQNLKPKISQLAYIYIATLISHIRIKNSNDTKHIGKLEKYILNNTEIQGKKEYITLIQLTKIIHELVRTYDQLDQDRIIFLGNVYQKIMTNYKLEQDLGLSIWNLWQQSIICKDANEFKNLFDKIKQNIDLVIESELETYNQSVKLKQYKLDMTKTVRELQKIQLYQTTMFYEVNENLYKKNEKLHQEIMQVKQVMNKCKSIQQFQKVQTVKHNSTFEINTQYLLNQLLKELNLSYTVVCEKQIENIYFIDFFIEELNLAIECNGNQHYIANNLYYNEVVRNKYLELKGYNIEIIQTSKFHQLSQEEQKTLFKNIILKYQNKK